MTTANKFISRCVLRQIEISSLRNHPANPRQELGDISELTESVRDKGITQTILVMPHPTIDGDYQILMGHRRVAAARAAGFDSLTALVAPADLSKTEQLEIMLVENLQRSNLKPSEEINGVQSLFDLGNSIQQVAKGLGKHPSTIKRYKKVARTSNTVKSQLDAGQITLERAQQIAEFTHHPDLRETLEKEATGMNFSFYYQQAKDTLEAEEYLPAAQENLQRLNIPVFTDSKDALEAGYQIMYGHIGSLPTGPRAVSELTSDQFETALPEGKPRELWAVLIQEKNLNWRAQDPNTTATPETDDPELKAKQTEKLEAERIEAGLVKNLAAARKTFSEHILHKIQAPKTLKKDGYAQGLALVMAHQGYRADAYASLLGFTLEGNTQLQQIDSFMAQASLLPFEKLLAALVAHQLGVSNQEGTLSARKLFELDAYNPHRMGAHSHAVHSFSVAEKLFGWQITPAEQAALNYYQPTFDAMYGDPNLTQEVNF